ncbi:MAG: response regulator [Kiritimatiellia bacterium]
MSSAQKQGGLDSGASPNGEACYSTQPRVLVVDDENLILRLYSSILEPELPHCEIDSAKNGVEALELFKRHWHSVLVLDLHMPVLDGLRTFNAIEEICRERQRAMPAVIFCTGFAPPGGVRAIIARDRRHCLLTKPVENDVLVAAVKERLAGAGSAQRCE